MTCVDEDSLEHCRCNAAEELYMNGAFVCPEDGGESCPQDCPVCLTCLYLVGCDPIEALSSYAPYETPIFIAIAMVTGIAVIALVISKFRKAQRSHSHEEPEEDHSSSYFAAESFQKGLGPSTDQLDGANQANVWLAPDM